MFVFANVQNIIYHIIMINASNIIVASSFGYMSLTVLPNVRIFISHHIVPMCLSL